MKYQEPEMAVIRLGTVDVITTSGDPLTPTDPYRAWRNIQKFL